jgi:thioredoxin reductase (NADPH)
MKNLIIIGSGPAGITASLYTAMSGIETTIIGTKKSALLKAEKIKNYYGFAGGISGKELFEAGIKQAEDLNVKIIQEEVISIDYFERYTVTTSNGVFECDSIILAMGKNRNKPRIKNLEKYEGHGISYCAVCDGFFYKKKKLAIIGGGEFALHEYEYLKNLTSDITVLTDGDELTASFPKVINEKIKEFGGEDKLNHLILDSGAKLDFDGVFIAKGTADSTAIAKKLGILTDSNNITVDENMSTNMPGIFACGDCIGGTAQISKSVADGMKAGLSAIKFLKQQ